MAQNVDPEGDNFGSASGDKHSDDSLTVKDNHAVSKRYFFIYF